MGYGLVWFGRVEFIKARYGQVCLGTVWCGEATTSSRGFEEKAVRYCPLNDTGFGDC